MQCSCGGEATLTYSERTRLGARLEFSECRACGRAGDATLLIDDVPIREDAGRHQAARDAYLNLTPASAEALRQEIARRPMLEGIDEGQQKNWIF